MNIRLPDRDLGTTPVPYGKRARIDTCPDEPWYSNGHMLLKGEPGRRNLHINSICFDNAKRLFPGCRLFRNKDGEPISATGMEHNNTLTGIVMPISPDKDFPAHAQHLQHR